MELNAILYMPMTLAIPSLVREEGRSTLTLSVIPLALLAMGLPHGILPEDSERGR